MTGRGIAATCTSGRGNCSEWFRKINQLAERARWPRCAGWDPWRCLFRLRRLGFRGVGGEEAEAPPLTSPLRKHREERQKTEGGKGFLTV